MWLNCSAEGPSGHLSWWTGHMLVQWEMWIRIPLWAEMESYTLSPLLTMHWTSSSHGNFVLHQKNKMQRNIVKYKKNVPHKSCPCKKAVIYDTKRQRSNVHMQSPCRVLQVQQFRYPGSWSDLWPFHVSGTSWALLFRILCFKYIILK